MNIFNRVVVVLLLVALILISAAVIVLPKQAITVASEFVAALDTYVSTFQGWVFMTIALLALMALCVVLLYLELRRVPSKTVRVEKISGGEARVAVESVAHRLQYNLDQLPQVLSVKPHVSARGKRVDITLDIETTQDVNIPAKTEEMSQITRSVIEEQMGLKLGKMIVSVRHTPVPSLERRRTVAAPPAPEVAPESPVPSGQEAPPPEPGQPEA
ncbi:MAG: hypothetical protein Kow00123_06270 [Anaerolineales bacterium]